MIRIQIRDMVTPEYLEKLEDKIEELLKGEGLQALIYDDETENEMSVN